MVGVPSIILLCRRIGMGVHARTVLPDNLRRTLLHISADTGASLAELLIEGAILLARWHGRGEGLPAPRPPLSATTNKEGGDDPR